MASKVDNVIKASRQRELDARQAEYEAIINSIPEGGAFKLADWHSVVTDEDTDASHRGITLRFSRAANRLGIKVEAKSMDDGSIIVKRPTLADLEAQAARTAERAARKAQAAAAPVATEGEPVDASENEPEPETVPETVPEAEAEAPAEAPAEEPRRRGRNAA
jgi:hypothetical protein